MCAIIDTSVVGLVFGDDRPEAGVEFFKWINSGKGKLVVGGELRKELSGSTEFRLWWQQAQLAGRAKSFDDAEIDEQTQKIKTAGGYRSNDPHVLALAQVSGARLLFTNDQALKRDFGNSRLIGPRRGKVYTTGTPGKFGTADAPRTFGRAHKNLLRRKDLCP